MGCAVPEAVPDAVPEAVPEAVPDAVPEAVPELPAAAPGPPNPAPVPPANRPVQAPLTGALIRTEVAVRPDDVSDSLGAAVLGAAVLEAAVVEAALAETDAWPEPPAPGAPPAVASTQEPTVTALISAVLVWLIVVVPV